MKTKKALIVIPFLVLILSSVTKASLDVGVSVEHSEINQFQDQLITATTNERGKGILLVVQPAEGTPWMDFLNDHPGLEALWNMLPNDIRTAIASKVGGKIVSFDLVDIGSSGGGSDIATFPEDFTGINGDPSTALTGKYRVVFAFLSWERPNDDGRCCCLFELEFGCNSWFVIPEVPLGTVVSFLSMIVAIPVFVLRKKIHFK